MQQFFNPGCLFLLCLQAVAAVGQERSPTISVVGEASVLIAADEIVIHASIESIAKTASQACKDNQEKSRKLVDFLKEMKINQQNIDADFLSIRSIAPEEPYSGKMGGNQGNQSNNDQNPFGGDVELEGAGLSSARRIIGYRAFRAFAIVIKDFEKFEEIYQGIVEQGINRVDRIEYRSSKEAQQRDELRILAVRNAKSKAAAMANELGAKLDSIKSISNESNRIGGRDSRGRYGMGDPFDGDSVSDSAGKIRMETSVSVEFSLRDTVLKK